MIVPSSEGPNVATISSSETERPMVVRWTGKCRDAKWQQYRRWFRQIENNGFDLFMRRVIFVVRSYKHKADLLIAVLKAVVCRVML